MNLFSEKKNLIKIFEKYILNDLLKVLIKDPSLNHDDVYYCEKLLNESIFREKELNKSI